MLRAELVEACVESAHVFRTAHERSTDDVSGRDCKTECAFVIRPERGTEQWCLGQVDALFGAESKAAARGVGDPQDHGVLLLCFDDALELAVVEQHARAGAQRKHWLTQTTTHLGEQPWSRSERGRGCAQSEAVAHGQLESEGLGVDLTHREPRDSTPGSFHADHGFGSHVGSSLECCAALVPSAVDDLESTFPTARISQDQLVPYCDLRPDIARDLKTRPIVGFRCHACQAQNYPARRGDATKDISLRLPALDARTRPWRNAAQLGAWEIDEHAQTCLPRRRHATRGLH